MLLLLFEDYFERIPSVQIMQLLQMWKKRDALTLLGFSSHYWTQFADTAEKFAYLTFVFIFVSKANHLWNTCFSNVEYSNCRNRLDHHFWRERCLSAGDNREGWGLSFLLKGVPYPESGVVHCILTNVSEWWGQEQSLPPISKPGQACVGK